MIIRLQLPLQNTGAPRSSQNLPSKPLKNPNPNPGKNSELLHGFTPLKTRSTSSPLPLPSTPVSDSGLLFRQKLLYLEALKVDSSKALEKNPNFRTAPLDSVKSVQKCLYSMGIDPSDVGRIFDMYPQLLTSDVDADLYPVFDFLLNDIDIPFADIRKCVVRCPRLLISGVEDQLRPAMYFLRRLGFVGRHTITCQTTLLLVSSVEDTLIPKIDYIQSLGFSYKETVKMVLRNPALLTYSIENNLRPKVEYFLNEMEGDLMELKKFPQYFSFSLEGRIKPRHRLLVEHGFSVFLPEMLKVSDGKFSNRLVEMRLQSLDRKFSLYRERGEVAVTTNTATFVFVWAYMKAMGTLNQASIFAVAAKVAVLPLLLGLLCFIALENGSELITVETRGSSLSLTWSNLNKVASDTVACYLGRLISVSTVEVQ